jgi:hypothetical protein
MLSHTQGLKVILCQIVLSVVQIAYTKTVYATLMKGKYSVFYVETVVIGSAITHIKNVRQIPTAKYAS